MPLDTNANPGYEHHDVAILGSGPAGMEAALVLSRTRKKVIVFDDPKPPRNAASHGAHNFLGVEGMAPGEVRKLGWSQILAYRSAELREERVVDIDRAPERGFLISGADGARVAATKVVLAVGYRDVYPEVPGFLDCWADTVIPCPFCDGYENRDRVWGIVPGTTGELDKFPRLALNWTSRVRVFLDPGLEISSSYREQLSSLGMTIHTGSIERIVHSGSKVAAVIVGGEEIGVGTLLWVPASEPSPLVAVLASKLGMNLNDSGHPATDVQQRTSVDGLWAAGDVLGWAGGLEAAAAGYRAATDIIRGWYA